MPATRSRQSTEKPVEEVPTEPTKGGPEVSEDAVKPAELGTDGPPASDADKEPSSTEDGKDGDKVKDSEAKANGADKEADDADDDDDDPEDEDADDKDDDEANGDLEDGIGDSEKRGAEDSEDASPAKKLKVAAAADDDASEDSAPVPEAAAEEA